ncbi:MAG TPA: efflux RND transporter periplasmic adaptor subunit [Blastocatellia bacterium]|nr:efflux RND transporter periplasmic adaptor subunit [Blastocatellia bacterium]
MPEDKLLKLDTPPGAEPPRPPNRLWVRISSLSSRAWLMIAASLLAFVLLVYLLWPAKKAATEEEAADIVVSVRVAEAERGTISAEVTALGTIYGREQATVSPKISAQIKSMPLVRNRRVKAGEVIATLEARDLQAQRAEAAAALDEALANLRLLSGGTIPEATAQDEKAVRDARANVNNARATYERRLQLFERGGISKKDLEASQLALTTAENDLRAAEAAARLHQTQSNPNNRSAATSRVKQAQDRLANLDTQLSYAVIRAPFAGVITDQFQYQGEFAAAGAKLFNIADDSEVIVKAPVADTVAASLRAGHPATVLPQDDPDEKIEAKVSLISPATDPQSRTVEVWVNLKNPDRRLHVNSAAKVVVTTNTVTDAVIVPAAAVTLKATNADEGMVMVVEEDPAAHEKVAHETKVTIGIRTPEQIEITSGLRGGETVIIEGNYALPDGTKVEINEDKEEEEGGKKEEEGGGSDKSAPGGGTPQQTNPDQQPSPPNQNGAAPTTPPNAKPATKGEPTTKPSSRPSSQPGGKP